MAQPVGIDALPDSGLRRGADAFFLCGECVFQLMYAQQGDQILAGAGIRRNKDLFLLSAEHIREFIAVQPPAQITVFPGYGFVLLMIGARGNSKH